MSRSEVKFDYSKVGGPCRRPRDELGRGNVVSVERKSAMVDIDFVLNSI